MTARDNACICTFEDGPREDCPACGRFPPEPSPARDNAETADLTLEVGSLREQLKESEGKCRALTVESEGWARQLSEATALLAEMRAVVHDTEGARFNDIQVTVNTRQRKGYRRMRDILLSRAPAQPAAPEPVVEMAPCYFCQATDASRSPCPLCHKCVCQLCAEAEGESCCDAQSAAPTPECRYYGSFCGDTSCPTHGIEEPAAPEPSAENEPPECDNCQAVIDGNRAATSDVCFDCWRSAKERTESAEAQLAAARDAYESETASYQKLLDEHGPDLQIDAICCLQDLQATIGKALTPAPSPGADPGRSGK